MGPPSTGSPPRERGGAPGTAPTGGAGTLLALVAERAASRPAATALLRKRHGIWHRTTYAELDTAVREVALALRGDGLGAGDRLALVADASPEWLVVDLAAQALGAVPLALDPTLPGPELVRLLGLAAAKVVVADADQVDRVLAVHDRLPALERVVVVDPRTLPRGGAVPVEGLSALRDRGGHIAAGDTGAAARVGAEVGLDDPALAATTSSATGPARAVVLSHAAVAGLARRLAAWLELQPRDRTLCHVPPALLAARVLDLYAPLAAGAPIGFPEAADSVPDDLADLAPTFLVTTARGLELMKDDVERRVARAGRVKGAANRLAAGLRERALERRLRAGGQGGGWRALLARGIADRAILAKLGLPRARRVACCGSALPPELQRFFWALGVPAVETYGQAETGGVAVAQRGLRDAGTVGVPLPEVDVQIGPGDEILLRTPALAAGYLDGSPLDLDDGWYRTGDLGELDSQGRLVVRGRRT